ncbi:hypothetical protein D9M68_336330 [compost metagenome]
MPDAGSICQWQAQLWSLRPMGEGARHHSCDYYARELVKDFLVKKRARALGALQYRLSSMKLGLPQSSMRVKRRSNRV